MRIGIIGPSKLEYLNEINKNHLKIIRDLAEYVAESGNEIVIVPDKGSVSEFFGLEYLKRKGKKIYEVLPLDDKEFGLSWVNQNLGEHINCGTWRNQPEKLNEETDIFLCLGYAVGGLIEIGYSKWFNKEKKQKPIYIINELVSGKLPVEIEKSLDLKYVSYKKFRIK
ncbi:MAG: hypothetical protein WC438_02950 [Candidatus Pacearchaeota archaeon]